MNTGQFKDNDDIRKQYEEVSGETFQRSTIKPMPNFIVDRLTCGVLAFAWLVACVLMYYVIFWM